MNYIMNVFIFNMKRKKGASRNEFQLGWILFNRTYLLF